MFRAIGQMIDNAADVRLLIATSIIIIGICNIAGLVVIVFRLNKIQDTLRAHRFDLWRPGR